MRIYRLVAPIIALVAIFSSVGCADDEDKKDAVARQNMAARESAWALQWQQFTASYRGEIESFAIREVTPLDVEAGRHEAIHNRGYCSDKDLQRELLEDRRFAGYTVPPANYGPLLNGEPVERWTTRPCAQAVYWRAWRQERPDVHVRCRC